VAQRRSRCLEEEVETKIKSPKNDKM